MRIGDIVEGGSLPDGYFDTVPTSFPVIDQELEDRLYMYSEVDYSMDSEALVDVPVGLIRVREDNVVKRILGEYRREFEETGRFLCPSGDPEALSAFPWGIRFGDGSVVVMDGTHRAEVLRERGSTVRMYVFDKWW